MTGKFLLFSIRVPILPGEDIPDLHTPEGEFLLEHPEALAAGLGFPKALIDRGVKVEFKVVEE